MTNSQLIVLVGTAMILALFAGALIILRRIAPIPRDRVVGGGLKVTLLGALIGWIGS